MNCWKTVNFLNELARICEAGCEDCPFGVEDCFDFITRHPQKAVEIVNIWSKERMEKDGELL